MPMYFFKNSLVDSGVLITNIYKPKNKNINIAKYDNAEFSYDYSVDPLPGPLLSIIKHVTHHASEHVAFLQGGRCYVNTKYL